MLTDLTPPSFAKSRYFEIEVLLGGNGYAEKTMESYQGHLRNWFALYGRDAAFDHKSDHDNGPYDSTP